MKWCVWGVVGVLAFSPSAAQGAMSVHFDLNVSPGHFSGSPSPYFSSDPSGFEYVTGLVSSADGVFQARTSWQGAWDIQAGVYSTLAGLKAAAQQPWYMLFDEGLPTERYYTMSLNLDGLQESDIAPPTISFPAQEEIISTLTPEFQFELGLPISHSYRLSEVIPGGTMTLASGQVAPGTTSLVPGVTLTHGSLYYFGLGTDVDTDQWGFSIPVDSEGTPIEDWSSRFQARIDTINQFYTILPEPSTYAMLASGLALMVMIGARRGRWAFNTAQTQ